MPTTLKGQPIDQRTDALGLPLPHIDNWHEDDVPRLRAAFTLIDLAMQVMGQDILDRATAMGTRVGLLEWAGARPSAVAYAYDGEGRLQTVTATVGGVARVTAYTYDAQGRPATISYPVAGGRIRTDTYSYDAQGRASGIASEETDQ